MQELHPHPSPLHLRRQTPVNVPCKVVTPIKMSHLTLRRSPPGNTPLSKIPTGYSSWHLRILFMALRMHLRVPPSSYWATRKRNILGKCRSGLWSVRQAIRVRTLRLSADFRPSSESMRRYSACLHAISCISDSRGVQMMTFFFFGKQGEKERKREHENVHNLTVSDCNHWGKKRNYAPVGMSHERWILTRF